MAETGETSTQKRSNNNDDNGGAETPFSRKKTRGGGPKFDDVWQYFIKGEEVNSGHYKATCYHCKKIWARGKPAALKAHLSNECLPCPEDIRKYWCDQIAEKEINYTRNLHSLQNPPTQSLMKQTKLTSNFGSNTPLPSQTNSRIDRSLLKAWVMAGIPFEVIENPFILDLFKDLNPGYIPPSRTTLSGRCLDEEVARVNKNMISELATANNLTLSKNFNILFNFFLKKY